MKNIAVLILGLLIGFAQLTSAQSSSELEEYSSCLKERNVAKQISSLESFLARYPDTTLKEKALETLLSAYENRSPNEVHEIAQRLLIVNHDNLNALSALTLYTMPLDKSKAREYAERGLRIVETAPKPPPFTDAEWFKRKRDLTAEFNLALGFYAVEQKDYSTAQRSLAIAAERYPRNFGVAYGLSLAYMLSPDAPDCAKGLWYLARAINLGPQGSSEGRRWKDYGKRRYRECFGNDVGWAKLLENTRTTSR